ncbi:MAG: RNA-binding S4 domain-containing protein [Hyphomicrobiaceae bacterium]
MTGPEEAPAPGSGPGLNPGGASAPQRLDKWLWCTRVVKSRTLAAALIVDGKVRVNRGRAQKPAVMIRPGDVVTVVVHGKVRVLKMLTPAVRRGPPPEARLLYEELTQGVAVATGGERPTKRDRRDIDRLRGR